MLAAEVPSRACTDPAPHPAAWRAVLVCALGLWGGLGCFLTFRLAGKGLDDFFITYRYALHLTRGQGFVFNEGERVFGLTNPGLAFSLAAGSWVTSIAIPTLATMLFGFSLVAIAGLLLSSARRRGLPEALGSGTLLLGSSFIWAQQGGEGIPMLALLTCAAELCVDFPLLAGLLAGAAVWFRPEAALGVGLLFILAWFERRTVPWRFAVAAVVVVGLGLAAATWYFGTPIPNSLAAKQAMAEGLAGAWSGPTRFWLRSARLVARHFGPLWAAVVALGVAGQVPLFIFGGRTARVLVLFGLTLAVFYPLSGVPWFPWYLVPTVVSILCGVPFLIGSVVRLLGRPPTKLRLATAAFACCLLAAPVIVSLVPASYHWFRIFNWPAYMERYRLAGLWLAGNSAPGATVSYYEVGALGYFSDRTVIDLLGIVTPEVLPYVRSGNFYGAFLSRPADYAIFDSARGGLMPVAAPWFRAAYRPVAGFGELTIYERQPGVPLPAAAEPR
jgi:hypothetical protein